MDSEPAARRGERATRVLNVVHYPVFGGPHNQALRLAAPLRSRGWETVVLIPDEPGNAMARLRAAQIPVMTLPLGRVRTPRHVAANLRMVKSLAPQVEAIRRLIREERIGVVQVNGLVNPHAAIAARRERVPLVWQILDTRTPTPIAVPAMALVHSLADAVMCTGMTVAKAHPGGLGLGNRLFLYYPPVDTDLFRPRSAERDEIRRTWGVLDRTPVVGCVANLNPQKGIVDLVAAFVQTRVHQPDAVLVLVGAEHPTHVDYANRVKQLIQSSGLRLGRDVLFIGERSDVHLQLAAMDVFAFAPVSRGEGISTVVLEAMAVGLPVAATAVGGLPEAIDNGIDGITVPAGDWHQLGNAISELLTSDRAAQLGARARKKALARFSLASAVDAHVSAYEFAVAHARQRGGGSALRSEELSTPRDEDSRDGPGHDPQVHPE